MYILPSVYHIRGVENIHTLSNNKKKKDFIQGFAFDMSDEAKADSDKHFTTQRL